MSDSTTERKYDFTLLDSLAKARSHRQCGPRLFAGYDVYATPSVAKGNLKAVSRIVSAAGGRLVKTAHSDAPTASSSQRKRRIVVVSDLNDAALCRTLRAKQGIREIYGFDMVSVSILRQKLAFGPVSLCVEVTGACTINRPLITMHD